MVRRSHCFALLILLLFFTEISLVSTQSCLAILAFLMRKELCPLPTFGALLDHASDPGVCLTLSQAQDPGHVESQVDLLPQEGPVVPRVRWAAHNPTASAVTAQIAPHTAAGRHPVKDLWSTLKKLSKTQSVARHASMPRSKLTQELWDPGWVQAVRHPTEGRGGAFTFTGAGGGLSTRNVV